MCRMKDDGLIKLVIWNYSKRCISAEDDWLMTWKTSVIVMYMYASSSVAVRTGASLPGRWLLPRVRQHLALSAVSWHSDLRGAKNIQQLRRQNFCSRWTSLVKLSSGPAVQSRHQLRTVRTTAEGTTFSGKHEHGALWLLICWCHRKTLTYLLTYLLIYTQ